MTWRLHLTNQAIPHLDILGGEPARLAAWARNDHVVFYDLVTGMTLDEKILEFPESYERGGAEWQGFLSQLTGPGDSFLPHVRMPEMTIMTSDDGRMRLYQAIESAIMLENNGAELVLDSTQRTQFLAVAMDRQLGSVAALDRDGKLHVYRQHTFVGAFDLGLLLEIDLRPSVAITHGGGAVFTTDGKTIVLTDSVGKIGKRVDTDHFVRLMDCSPGGRYLVTCDMEAGVIRVFAGDDLTLSYQRFAIDLVAEAIQVQLMANLPPTSVAPSALTINDEGVLAFAMSGVVCVTNLSHFDHLPSSKAHL